MDVVLIAFLQKDRELLQSSPRQNDFIYLGSPISARKPTVVPSGGILARGSPRDHAANAESITNNMTQTKQLKRESEKQMI